MGCCLFGRRMMHEHVMTNLSGYYDEVYLPIPGRVSWNLSACSLRHAVPRPRCRYAVPPNDRTSPLSVICLTVGANVTPAISLIPYFRFNYDNSLIAMSLATIQTGISTPHPAKFNFFTLLIIWDLISRLIKQSLKYQLDGLAALF